MSPSNILQSQQQQQQQQQGAPTFSASSANIDILVANAEQGEMEEPSKAVQEKVAFIFNNLSQSNVSNKVFDSLQSLFIRLLDSWCFSGGRVEGSDEWRQLPPMVIQVPGRHQGNNGGQLPGPLLLIS